MSRFSCPGCSSTGIGVKVLDLYWYGDDVLGAVADHPDLEQVNGDIRDRKLLHLRVIPPSLVGHRLTFVYNCAASDGHVPLCK